MEENNRKGPGIFYAVTGVATLVVAIIGATFAYFSASAAAQGDTIEGTTLDVQGGVLSAMVERVNFTTPGTTSDQLVPAYFGKTGEELNVPAPGNLKVDHVETLLANKCAEGGYTGCHVWKITATTTQSVADADVMLTLETKNVSDTSQWGYAVFTAEGDTVALDGSDTEVTLVGTPAAIGTGVSGLDIHGRELTVGDEEESETVTYFLLVYVNDIDAPQNDAENASTNVTGSYNGSITFQAAGGQVRASFAA